MKKKIFLMLPCIAAVAIATLVGKKTMESNALKSNDLLAQNVEALTSPEDGGYDDVGCSGPSIYSTVGNTTWKEQKRVHVHGIVGGEYSTDKLYDLIFKQCFAKGYGTNTGTNYVYLMGKTPFTYVKCDGTCKNSEP